MNTPESPTPRTDIFVSKETLRMPLSSEWIDFARTLERELAAANALAASKAQMVLDEMREKELAIARAEKAEAELVRLEGWHRLTRG